MTAITTIAPTITSLELVEYINQHRKSEAERVGAEFPSKGFAFLQHKHFLPKVLEVLGVETSAKFSADLPDSYGRPQPGYRFEKREACLMAMSYSYDLQAKVFDRMTALEAKAAAPVALALPDFTDPAEAAIAWATEYKAKQQAQIERDDAIRTKHLIGSKREASAMATASAATREAKKLREELGHNARHATCTAVEIATGQKFDWLPMRRWCKANGITPASVPDKRFGHVNAWPAAAWKAAHQIDLIALFGEVSA